MISDLNVRQIFTALRKLHKKNGNAGSLSSYQEKKIAWLVQSLACWVLR
jgi:hypothetical protein